MKNDPACSTKRKNLQKVTVVTSSKNNEKNPEDEKKALDHALGLDIKTPTTFEIAYIKALNKNKDIR